MRTTIFVVLSLLICTRLFAGSHRMAATYFTASTSNYDITYHKISFTVNPGTSGKLSAGCVETHFRTTVANVSNIQFDLDCSAMAVDSVYYHGAKLATANYTTNTTTDVVSINLPASLSTLGTWDVIFVYFSGTPVAPATSIPSGYNYGRHPKGSTTGGFAIYTLDEAFTGHTWWPCKESLYDKIDSVDLVVTAPTGYKVAGNGTLVSEVTSGSNIITTWSTRYPTATYGINFAVANYQVYSFNLTTTKSGVTYPVQNYFYTEDNNATFQGYVNQLKTIIPMYERVFGVDYPFAKEKYGMTDCYGSWGALEVQSNTFIATNSYNDNGYTIAHEMAHQWFGDMITTNTWHQTWLNEGFAQYCQSVIYPENLKSATELQSQRKAVHDAVTTTGTTYISDTSTADKIFFDPSSTGSQPYNKGAMLLSMLRTWVGDTHFFNALKNYLTSKVAYGFGSVDTLQKYMQAETRLDLTNFFNDWITKKGYAKYTIQWATPTKQIVIKAIQSPTSAGAGYFDMPIPIRITGPGLDTTVIIIDQRGQLFNNVTASTSGSNTISFKLSATPTAISVDPNYLVLATATTAVNLTLPVHDITLNAVKGTNNVQVNWSVNADEKLSAINLEKSVDGIHFDLVKSFNAISDTRNIHEGSYTDKDIHKAQYYRLKVVTGAGNTLYSTIKKIEYDDRTKLEIIPNPAHSEIHINVPSSFNASHIKLIIQNMNGQSLKERTVELNGLQEIKLSIIDLIPGLYNLILINDRKEQLQTNFLKQ